MIYQAKTMKGAGPSMYVLVMGILVVMTVVLFGSALFIQAVQNGGYVGAQSNYPLAVQVNKFNTTISNFTSQIIQTDQGATNIPANQDPATALSTGLSKGASVIGLTWAMLSQLQSIIAVSLTILAPWVPAWVSFIAIGAVAIMFGFAALGYILRWFV